MNQVFLAALAVIFVAVASGRKHRKHIDYICEFNIGRGVSPNRIPGVGAKGANACMAKCMHIKRRRPEGKHINGITVLRNKTKAGCYCEVSMRDINAAEKEYKTCFLKSPTATTHAPSTGNQTGNPPSPRVPIGHFTGRKRRHTGNPPTPRGPIGHFTGKKRRHKGNPPTTHGPIVDYFTYFSMPPAVYHSRIPPTVIDYVSPPGRPTPAMIVPHGDTVYFSMPPPVYRSRILPTVIDYVTPPGPSTPRKTIDYVSMPAPEGHSIISHPPRDVVPTPGAVGASIPGLNWWRPSATPSVDMPTPHLQTHFDLATPGFSMHEWGRPTPSMLYHGDTIYMTAEGPSRRHTPHGDIFHTSRPQPIIDHTPGFSMHEWGRPTSTLPTSSFEFRRIFTENLSIMNETPWVDRFAPSSIAEVRPVITEVKTLPAIPTRNPQYLSYSEFKDKQCIDKPYTKVGCFKFTKRGRYLLNYRYDIEWSKERLPHFAYSFVCACAHAAKQAKVPYFATHFWGECWEVSPSDDQDEESSGCMLADGLHKTNCEGDEYSNECLGTTNYYVYSATD